MWKSQGRNVGSEEPVEMPKIDRETQFSKNELDLCLLPSDVKRVHHEFAFAPPLGLLYQASWYVDLENCILDEKLSISLAQTKRIPNDVNFV